MSDALPPAGWFPDPEDSANLRYWDGAAWTDHRHPVTPVAEPVAEPVNEPAADAPAGVTPPTAIPPAVFPPAGIPAATIPAAAPVAATPQFAYQPTAGLQPGAAAPYGASPAYAAPQNVMALVGLILSIAGAALGLLLNVVVLVAIAGGVLSIFGLMQANRMRLAGTPNDRRGMALAGILVGFGGLVLVIVAGAARAIYYAALYSYF